MSKLLLPMRNSHLALLFPPEVLSAAALAPSQLLPGFRPPMFAEGQRCARAELLLLPAMMTFMYLLATRAAVLCCQAKLSPLPVAMRVRNCRPPMPVQAAPCRWAAARPCLGRLAQCLWQRARLRAVLAAPSACLLALAAPAVPGAPCSSAQAPRALHPVLAVLLLLRLARVLLLPVRPVVQFRCLAVAAAPRRAGLCSCRAARARLARAARWTWRLLRPAAAAR